MNPAGGSNAPGNRPPRVLFLSPAAQSGGAEAALLDLLAALRGARPGWELRLLSAEDGPMLGRARALGAEAEVLPLPPTLRGAGEANVRGGGGAFSRLGRFAGLGVAAVSYAARLRARLRELRPDLIHSNGMKTHALAAAALTLPGAPRAPLVWALHDYLGGRRAMAPLLRRLAGRCSLALAVSESVAADARKVLPKRVPVRAVHNAVDLAAFTPDGPALDLDALAGLPTARPGGRRVGLVATFAIWKGHDVFLQAAARCLAAGGAAATAAVRFYVLGGPIYATAGSQRTLEELRASARAAGLRTEGAEATVGFTGFVADAAAGMRALDVVVHASTRPEPFGLVIAQAMACGRPVVSSAAGGARELVEPETDALVHPRGDAEELARQIGRLLADAGLRARLAAAGRRRALAQFSRERLAAEVAPIYESLLAR